MALPFLPWNHIPDVLATMRRRCPQPLQELMDYRCPQPLQELMDYRCPQPLQELMDYIDRQWMQNPIFSIKA
jgi:hypothetical protein